MAQQASYNVADPELARRNSGATEGDSKEYTDDEMSEKEEVDKIMEARKRYQEDRRNKEQEWTQSYKMYMSWVDRITNPFLSNLFIPKTHQAVELLAAFLIGANQSISATPENGKDDTLKAEAAGKWLDFLWRKVVKARTKILIWIKQGIIFGNGILKVGWDADEDKPFLAVRPIQDVYFDYFVGDIQDSEYIVDEVRRTKEAVMNDEKYDLADKEGKLIREMVVEGGSDFKFNTAEALFNTYDGSVTSSECEGKILVCEVWCKETDEFKTILPTALGWRIARRRPNPNFYTLHDGKHLSFMPFVKLRFKTSPQPNRAYDMGAVWPTVRLQRAFNDLMNQYFDNVQLVNDAMWVKRRGARINPMDLVRRPGGIVTVSDVDKDLKPMQTPEIKQSLIEMINRLDSEFQRASMVFSLLQQFSDTATGDALEQQPLQAIRDMINQNIVEALSEAGQMLLAISINNAEGIQSIKLFESDAEVGILDFEPKDIDGFHDVKVIPDRSSMTNKDIMAKSLADFIAIVSKDLSTIARYPKLPEKLYKRWLELRGVSDVEWFFEDATIPTNPMPGDPNAPEIVPPNPMNPALPPAIPAAPAIPTGVVPLPARPPSPVLR